MYNSKLAFAVKCNNRVLREFGETVYLPFGSEYSLLIKNMNTVDVIVHIDIDGQKVCPDGLIISKNSSCNLERFIGKNLNQGNRFKFVERNAAIEKSRGIGVEDGLIRVEYEFASAVPVWPYNDFVYTSTPSWGYDPMPTYSYSHTSADPTLNIGSALRGVGGSSFSTQCYASGAAAASAPEVMPQNATGITVPGSVSDQRFSTVSAPKLDGVKHVMILKLLGETESAPVKAPVTVKTKQKCITCGHMNKATAKFCSECGTGLTIV